MSFMTANILSSGNRAVSKRERGKKGLSSDYKLSYQGIFWGVELFRILLEQ